MVLEDETYFDCIPRQLVADFTEGTADRVNIELFLPIHIVHSWTAHFAQTSVSIMNNEVRINMIGSNL